MEQITKRNGEYYYGGKKCKDADAAYTMFRDEYHKELGRCVSRRLNRIGSRVERVHGFGFDFDRAVKSNPEWYKYKKVQCKLLGLVGTCYYRIFGIWDIPQVSEEEYEEWFDWAFSRHSTAVALKGRKDNLGRTSIRYKQSNK